MSLLDSIKSKKQSLRSTETIVTLADGKKLRETKEKTEFLGVSYGFVVDTKPDKTPAKIIPNLYLGAQDCCEREVLDSYNLRVVLSVGIEPSVKYENVIYKYIECLDLPETDIKDVLNVAVPTIDEYILENNILVHCNAGVSRSCSVVIGYLILKRGFSYESALQACKDVRPCVRPNDGFEKQLKMLNSDTS
ncbi:dual specificity protein phosphatase 19 [Diabrotica virgifera virgifera]|uniref:Dual specificity protein phosphatase 19 isoform X1 n=1 Tax=Diabrotica virgifera virgifera TaxID=50390 RepID=A0A6P7HB04_DIAVI|nr:dual specificity protein phosphatase 19 [Diabrotica virgifera virgifera]